MKAMELLQDRTRWTQLALARDTNGRGVNVNSSEAVAFCAAGAIAFCYKGEDCNRVLMKAGNVAKKLFGHPALTTFNNDPKTTFVQVMLVLKEADV